MLSILGVGVVFVIDARIVTRLTVSANPKYETETKPKPIADTSLETYTENETNNHLDDNNVTVWSYSKSIYRGHIRDR